MLETASDNYFNSNRREVLGAYGEIDFRKISSHGLEYRDRAKCISPLALHGKMQNVIG